MKGVRMMERVKRRVAQIASPRGFLVYAVMIVVGYVVLGMLGFRESTTLLSGSLPAEDATLMGTAARCAVYMLFYFGAVVGAPIWFWGREL